ncbi:ABC transporter ATP-binding protein [Martelella alba]|uniref:ABC transporter ATP-binding protein n=1 Tax=Martelella alba TaxID=2590451 RepID=A0A506U3I6_9HYPH|nr:ABC transporter ATP-binding protein [Martelella alba]TPW27896.1 ABC transporter ATP-binding protein [Martelella alba]
MVELRLENIGARYGHRLAVSGITTPRLNGGEVVAVIGPNAAGKSTLFRRIAGLLHGPGVVHLHGSGKGKRTIGYMPQDISANAVLTVYESILLARKQGHGWAVHDEDLAMIDAVMTSLGIDDLAFRELSALSGGQRQLVSIAQTLAREPDILLMDEPTSALDLHRQIEVLELVRTEAKARGMLVMIAIHDLNQALHFADKALVIAGGKMHACGRVSDVVTADMLRMIYKVEARIERCSHNLSHVIVDGRS